ncbi:MAG: trehalose-phosphatase [Chromatiales bacterium]|nr:MAG: trehalose-phosphatase [Chromatiales bacterium]
MLPSPPPAPERPIALFLDFDGTLVEIAPRPGDVVVGDSLRALLESLHVALGGALAVVSGRRLSDLLAHLAPLRVPATGSHGLEYQLRPGHSQSTTDARLPECAWRELEAFVAAHPALLLEHKGHGAAVHFRQAPELADAVAATLGTLRDRDAPDFMLQAGKMVWELRPQGITKATAIERFMATPPFAGRLPVFVGDDVTDEDGFRAVNALGGWAIYVGEDAGDTVAGMALPDVTAVHRWLRDMDSKLSRHCA